MKKYQSPAFAFERVEPGQKNIPKGVIAIGYVICFSIGFLVAYLASDADNAQAVKQAWKQIHKQNDEQDFLNAINIFPQMTLTKYWNDYERRNATMFKLWNENKPGGEGSFFEDGRTIPNNLKQYVQFEKNLTHEAYFKIFNVPVTSFIYVDIWMYNSNVMGQADYDLLEHITKYSQHQEFVQDHDTMNHQFKTSFTGLTLEDLKMSDYANAMNGYARIITYEVLGNDVMKSQDGNKVLSMYEGHIYHGKPNGLGRKFEINDENVHVGYWKNGVPSGKHIHYNNQGIYQEGIWLDNGEIQEKKVTSFIR